MSELAFRLRGLTERQVDEHRPDRTLRASTRLVVSTVAIVAIVYSDQIHKAVAVVDHTGVSLLQAKQAVQLAERTNAHGVFILKEGIDKARALKGASGADVAAAAHIVSIHFNRSAAPPSP